MPLPLAHRFCCALSLACAAGACSLPARRHLRHLPAADASLAERAAAWRRYRLSFEEPSGDEIARADLVLLTAAARCGGAASARGCALPGPPAPRFHLGPSRRNLARDQALRLWLNDPGLARELDSSETLRRAGVGAMIAGGAGLVASVVMVFAAPRSPDAGPEPAPLAVGLSSLTLTALGGFLMWSGGSSDADDVARSSRYNRWLLGRLGLAEGGAFTADPRAAAPGDAR